MRRFHQGFTLLEMLITIIIIGILAAIAIPNYQAQVQKTRRSDARIGLVETAQKLERCFAQFGSYNHANCSVAVPVIDHYTISIVTRTTNAYLLSAKVTVGGAQSGDSRCATLTFDHTGHQGAKNADAQESAANCWQ